ncbi:cytochrome P450 [Phytomonospora sp. NPDC050363]|uniref:cytochrome P450 family protein n=1 Tax=Phytomonospora sp. NPDC050363 TaxID=3155642 RepID=UPI0033E569A4
MSHPSPALVVMDSTGRRLYRQTDELRAGGDATRVALPGGLTAWSVTSTPMIKSLVTDPRVTRDPRKGWPGFTDETQPPWMMPWTPASMFNASGTDHTRLRKLISPAFTQRRVEALRPSVTAIVDGLLDALTTAPQGEPVDLRATFSYKIPITVICDLLGVPKEHRDLMAQVMEAAIDTSMSAEEAAANNYAMVKAIIDLIAAKREEPGDDMTTQLLDIHDDGDRLTEQELVATLILMVGAGSETAVSLIDHSTVALLTHPEHLATTRAEDRWNDVIEESLRRDAPIMHIPARYALEDITLPDGTLIRTGELILIGFGAAGRDPSAHDRRDEWDLDRTDKAHLAFGHGIHYCMGAPLARLEATVALRRLFDRFDVELAVEPSELRRQPSFIGNDYSAVPVLLTRR